MMLRRRKFRSIIAVDTIIIVYHDKYSSINMILLYVVTIYYKHWYSLVILLFFACLVVTKHSSTKFGASSSPTNAYLASSTLQVTDSATSGLLYCNWLIVDCCFFSAECCMALSLSSLGAQSAASWVALLNRNRCIIVDCCFCALSLSLQRQVLHSLSHPTLSLGAP